MSVRSAPHGHGFFGKNCLIRRFPATRAEKYDIIHVMKIKKPVSEAGGAAIADRFKLENVESDAKGRTVGKTSTTIAFCAALAALAVAGILVYTLYRHWVFLMPA